jgi:hypothetical protein
MRFSLIIKEEAHRDADLAYDYYESRQVGLGERFLGALVARHDDYLSIRNFIATSQKTQSKY